MSRSKKNYLSELFIGMLSRFYILISLVIAASPLLLEIKQQKIPGIFLVTIGQNIAYVAFSLMFCRSIHFCRNKNLRRKSVIYVPMRCCPAAVKYMKKK